MSQDESKMRNEEDSNNSNNDKRSSSPQDQIDNRNPRLRRKIHRNLFSIIQLRVNPDLFTNTSIIPFIQKHSLKRTNDDLALIKNFLIKSKLMSKLIEDEIPSYLFERLAAIMSVFLEYKFSAERCTLYQGGTPPSYIYLIIKGGGTKYSLEKLLSCMTGYEYFKHIVQLRDKNDTLILAKTVRENFDVYPIQMKDLKLLSLILFKLAYMKHKGKEVEELFCKAAISPSAYDIDLTQEKELIEDKVHQLQLRIQKREALAYDFLYDDNTKNRITIFQFNRGTELVKGDYCGNYENDMYLDTVDIEANTELCCIKFHIYDHYIRIEQRTLINQEIDFLVKSFFFKTIFRKKFEFEFYHMFSRQKYFKSDFIFRANEPVTHVYFIQEGEVDLMTNVSVLEMHVLINLIKEKAKRTQCDMAEYLNTKNHPMNLLKSFRERKLMHIFTYGDREVIGHESFYYQLNHLFSARVRNERVVLYKIPIKKLLMIFKDESEAFEDFRAACKMKLEIFLDRLNFMNSMTIGIIDSNTTALNGGNAKLLLQEPTQDKANEINKNAVVLKSFEGDMCKVGENKKDPHKAKLFANVKAFTDNKLNQIEYFFQKKAGTPQPVLQPIKKIRRNKSYEDHVLRNVQREIVNSKLVLANECTDNSEGTRYRHSIERPKSISTPFLTQLMKQTRIRKTDGASNVSVSSGSVYKAPLTLHKLNKVSAFNFYRNQKAVKPMRDSSSCFTRRFNFQVDNCVESEDVTLPFHNQIFFHKPFVIKQNANAHYKKYINSKLNDFYS